jgi:hypothetical protein
MQWMNLPVLNIYRFLPLLFLLVASRPLNAQRTWSFELHGGVTANMPLPLTIIQQNYPIIYFKQARYYSEPLKSPYYWDWRFSKWFGKHSIEFEAIHHKLYLKSSHPDIQRFGISHGFNMLTFNYAHKFNYFIFRNGIGSVLLHPESTIRNKVYPEGPGFDIKGYRLRGFVFHTAIAKQIPIVRKRLFINTEVKASFAKANAPIVDGIAKVNAIVLQGIVGLGVRFAGTTKDKD